MPSHETPAQEWDYWETAAPPHAGRHFPRLSDALRPDYADPHDLADLAAEAALGRGRVSEAWQWAHGPDQAATRRRIRAWRTLWRLGILRPEPGRGPGRFVLAPLELIQADAAQMTPEDRAKALAYGKAVHTWPGQAAILAAAARRHAKAIASLQAAQAAALAAIAERRPAADVLPFPRGGRDALRRQTIAGQQRQRLAEAIAL